MFARPIQDKPILTRDKNSVIHRSKDMASKEIVAVRSIISLTKSPRVTARKLVGPPLARR